jgi:NADP-dependent aldehyde dehydrogenase
VELVGRSIIGGVAVAEDDSVEVWSAVDPATGVALEPAFQSARSQDVERAAALADDVVRCFGSASGAERAGLLEGIAAELEANLAAIVDRARRETALPEARLQAELGRTAGQLRMFAELVSEGSWVDARIDHADGARRPVPKPDVRSMLRPLGPVAVFGASNFPLAFSVAGVDTAAALAAGNPVIAKAHPAHPGTSELVGWAIVEALRKQGVSQAVFALLLDAGTSIGTALVDHRSIRAVGFTGSHEVGRALMDRAAKRPEPIPVFAEMGAINPVFVLPGALGDRAEAVADQLVGSLTLGVGQYCTNPGLLVIPAGPIAERFVDRLRDGLSAAELEPMLTRAICEGYGRGVEALAGHDGVQPLLSHDPGEDTVGTAGVPALLATDAATFVAHRALHREVFGPAALLVRCPDQASMIEVARSLEGQLSATVWGTEAELERVGDLLRVLERKAGRLLFNGVPTGVEVCPAMVHGGPYPATADGRSSSVGTRAIERFARPVAYQDYPEAALPAELRETNPLGIWRLVDGRWGRR